MNKRNLSVASWVVLFLTFTCKAEASESRRTMPRQTEVTESKVKKPSDVSPIQKILDYTSSLHGLYKIEVPKEFQPLQSVQKVSINSEFADSMPLKIGPDVHFVGQRHKLYWIKDRAIQFVYKLKSPLNSQPAILTDGTVIVPTDNKILWVNNGELKYSYALKSLSRVTPTILAENIVVLSNSDKIYWLQDGVLVNQFDILKNVERTDNVKIDLSNTTAAKLLDGTLVVGLYNGIVIWLKNGKKIYSYKANDVFESSPVVVNGDTVAIGTKKGRLLWLKNGKLLHQYDAPSLKADIVSLSDGAVVVTSIDEGIYWLKNGKVIFKNTDLDGFFTTTPVVSLNNIVVMGSSKGVLYWFKDGKVIQKYQFPKWVISRPYFESEGNFAIGPQGEFLYFVSQVSGDLKK